MCHQVDARQKMGLWRTTSLVAGNLIGSGVFLLPVTLAHFGPICLVGWAVTGIGAILLALVFGELAKGSADLGGPSVFNQRAFGPKAGFYTAWGYWVLSWISNAALIVGATSYLGPLLGELSPWQNFLIELFILMSITLINLMGIALASKVELVLTGVKLIPLLILPILCLNQVSFDSLTPLVNEGISSWDALKSTLFLTIWGFIGLETATVPAGEVSHAKKIIPLATLLGTSLAMVVYFLGTLVILGALPKATLLNSSAPYADLAGLVFSGNWQITMALAAVICCLGSFNGWTLVVSRIPQTAAKQNLFPKIFAKVNNKGTPYWGLLVSSGCTLPLLFLALNQSLIEQFNFIIDVSITLILLIYFLCVLSYFKGLFAQGVRSKLKLALGIGALVFTVLAIWAAGLKMLILSLVILVLGWPFWTRVKRQKEVVSSKSKEMLAAS